MYRIGLAAQIIYNLRYFSLADNVASSVSSSVGFDGSVAISSYSVSTIPGLVPIEPPNCSTMYTFDWNNSRNYGFMTSFPCIHV